MQQRLAQEFSFPELLRFAFPSIVMMVFVSLYTIVDGLFVSNFVGPEAVAALNLVYPVQGVALAIGIMFATGGSVLVAIRMGQGRNEEARSAFTLILVTSVTLSLAVTVLTLTNLESLCRWLGAEGETLVYSEVYLGTLICFIPVGAIQLFFQSFFVTAGRPKLGLVMNIGAGVFNIVFDYLLVVPGGMGVQGAALATGGGYCIPAIGGLIFFWRNRNGLCFRRPKWDGRLLLQTCANGSSEMVTNLSSSVTTLLLNFYTLRFAGTDGVAAITAVFYCQFLMTSMFMGFSMGVSPVISYHYGAENRDYLRRTVRRCGSFVLLSSAAVWVISLLGVTGIVSAFFRPGTAVFAMAVRGFRIFVTGFLGAGINIFASALFTAIGDGKTSALISFSRTLFFEVLAIVVLGYFFQMDGVWMAVPAAEFITVGVVGLCTIRLRRENLL